jgi:competence protein ComEC
LGDTSLEKEQFVEDMRRSGLTHLTAVSGENFAIIAAFILWGLAFFVRSMRIRILITASILIAFIFLVRPSPSVMRASVMTAVLLVGKIKGERGSALPALGLAIGLLVLLDPFQAIDPGFALSVSATAGILIASDPIALYLSRFIGQSKIVEMLAIPIAATLFCTPLIMAISGQLSLVSLPANLLASEVVAPITIIGFIAALASPIIPGFSHLLLLLCKPFSAWIVFIAHALGSLPVLKVPKSFLGAAIALIAIILIIRKSWKLIATITIMVVAVHFGLSMGWPGSNWVYVNCDVGQGDGAVINLGGGSAIVIDVGPEPVAMDSCLSALHIKIIALLVLTHYHADHVNGLSGAMHGREVESVWVTNNPEPALEFAQIRELLQSHPLTVVHQGQKSEFDSQLGRVKILVLWPRVEVEKLPSLPGDGSGINNSSIALLISIGKFSIYTSGDTEPPAQQAIAESGLIHMVDLMKVSHHGSAYQYAPLLDLLRPKVATISVGAGNTYGHPAQTTIAALEQRGVRVLRTDLDGAIALDQDLRISTQKRKWWDISWG